MSHRHTTKIDVYYEDTDCGGVVYYANYLNFFERARTQALVSLGVHPAEWMKKGVMFTVTRAEVDYKGPAVYGAALLVETKITNVKGPRLTFMYTVTREDDGALVVTGKTDMACVNEKMRPRRIPPEIVERIK